MMITCPRCFASYDVPERALRRPAQKVRCSACGFAWEENPPPRDAIAGFAPKEAPADLPPPSSSSSSAPRAVAKKQEKPQKQKAQNWKKSPLGPILAWTGLAVASVLVLAVVFREPIGHSSPLLAGLYEDVGLPVETPEDWFRFTIEDPTRSEQGDKTVLSLSGQITNRSSRTRTAPPVRIFWRGTEGQEGPSVTVTPTPVTLPSGESASFRGELVGVDARAGGEIKVTFASEEHE